MKTILHVLRVGIGILALLALAADASFAQRSYSHRSIGSHHASSYQYGTHHRSTYTYGVARDAHGRIRRSGKERYEFMKETGYPHGRKGYVIDHIVPLSKGGCDCPSNMQWQTKEEAKQKDRTERH